MRSDPKTETVSTKLPASLLLKLERLSEIRGVSRSALLHDLVEAAVSGRVLLDVPGAYADYSTRSDARKVAANERNQRRMAVQNARQVAMDKQRAAEDAREVAAFVRQSKARLRRQAWPEGFNLREYEIDE